MNFLTFLLYFMGSIFIYNITMFAIRGIIRIYLIYKFKKNLKNGKIKMATMDNILATDEDKKTWN